MLSSDTLMMDRLVADCLEIFVVVFRAKEGFSKVKETSFVNWAVEKGSC
jgi:hypothetical protein